VWCMVNCSRNSKVHGGANREIMLSQYTHSQKMWLTTLELICCQNNGSSWFLCLLSHEHRTLLCQCKEAVFTIWKETNVAHFHLHFECFHLHVHGAIRSSIFK
jgi:hypothetical protein